MASKSSWVLVWYFRQKKSPNTWFCSLLLLTGSSGSLAEPSPLTSTVIFSLSKKGWLVRSCRKQSSQLKHYRAWTLLSLGCTKLITEGEKKKVIFLKEVLEEFLIKMKQKSTKMPYTLKYFSPTIKYLIQNLDNDLDKLFVIFYTQLKSR